MTQVRSAARTVPPFAWRGVLPPLATLTILLASTSPFYGYHRDELYFRMLPPAWGYVDQPPLTPFLARSLAAIVDEPWMLRVPAVLGAVGTVLVVALIAREAGGARRAQALAAWAAAGVPMVLVNGHVLLTSAIDQLVWVLVCLFAVRAVLRDDPRWWMLAGAVAGVGSFNKLLVAVLLAGVATGLAVFGPRRVFARAGCWAGAGIALVLAVPNLVYQAMHDWPQLRMGAALAAENGAEVRAEMWLNLLLLGGPLLAPIWIAGIVAVFRRPGLRGARFVVAAFAVVLAFTWAGASQGYYPLALVPVLLAIGSVSAARWMRTRWRSVLVWAAVAVNGAVSVVIVLPVVPVHVLGSTPLPELNEATADTVGWPRYVAQIAAAVRAAGTDPVIVTSNYGEAGAVARYGPDAGIGSVVFSGHNALGEGPPAPESANAALFVGRIGPPVRAAFDACTEVGRLDNGVGVANEEQGLPLIHCTGRTEPWAALWPRMAHLD